MQSPWIRAAALLALAATQAQAQEPPAYRCGARKYSDIPCSGAREVGTPQARKTDRYAVPPQDRAKLARRAQMTPELRQQCEAMEVDIRELDDIFKAKGPAATADDERPLVQTRLKYRELKC